MTSDVRERELLPLRFPLDRGLMGWRLLLVRRSEQQRFAGIRSLDGLASMTAGQMHDWPDTQILRANGLKVGTGSSYSSLFAMLARRPYRLLSAFGAGDRRRLGALRRST